MIRFNNYEPPNEKSLLRAPVEVPTHEEDQQLIGEAQGGDLAARNELIVRHLPAIITYAHLHFKLRRCPRHVDPEDLIHVGVIATMHAIKKYNMKKASGRFISYARLWMRDYINKAIETYRMYGVPKSTKYYYDTGRLKNPETRKAIEHCRHLIFYGDKMRAVDTHLSPEEEAIFREELEHAKTTRKRVRKKTANK